MEDVRFCDIASHLRDGREIEFGYQGKMYSITNSGDGYWYFCCDTDEGHTVRMSVFKELERLAEQAGTILIDGIPVSEIFDQALYERDKLCIL